MLMVVWSGELERKGKCPGLSTYGGPSQLCPAMRVRQTLAHGEAGKVTFWRRLEGRFPALSGFRTAPKALRR